MTTEEYKSICKLPNILARWTIEATKRSLDANPALGSKLGAILDGDPILKPDSHKGGKETDHFRVRLTEDEAQQIQDWLIDLEVGAVGANGETMPDARYFASLADIWQEYLEFGELEPSDPRPENT